MKLTKYRIGILLLLTALISAGCVTEQGGATQKEQEEYKITAISDDIIFLEILTISRNPADEICKGLQEISVTYNITDTTPVTKYTGYGSQTSALIVHVTPK